MKNPTNVIQARREKLLALLKEVTTATVASLSQQLEVSEITIRRDLALLEQMGALKRTHGGAIYQEIDNLESSNDELEKIKQKLAKKAVEFLHDGNTLFLNTGTTAMHTLQFLGNQHITVITNNVKIANLDHNPNTTIILSGGEIRFPKEALVGDIAIESFSRMSSDVTILSCSGFSLENGITTSVLYEAKINNLMIERTKGLVIVVADYRKIGLSENFISGDLEDVHYLITDSFANPDVIREIEKRGVQVIQVPV